MKTFRVERMYFNSSEYPREVLLTGLTEKQAQAFCRSKETSSRTCKLKENMKRTEECGPWFCGYSKET